MDIQTDHESSETMNINVASIILGQLTIWQREYREAETPLERKYCIEEMKALLEMLGKLE